MPENSKKSGMSTTVKVVIGVCVSGGLLIAVCCGVAIWFGSQAINVTQDPDTIDERLTGIVTIDVPTGWEPMMAMRMNMGFKMDMVMYSPDPDGNQGRGLMVMQMQIQGASQAEMEQQMRMQSSQQGMNNQEITIESSETRTFTIDGQDYVFQFAVGTDSSGNSVHQVSGVIPARNGTGMLMFVERDEHWDEAAVVQMIESISAQ